MSIHPDEMPAELFTITITRRTPTLKIKGHEWVKGGPIEAKTSLAIDGQEPYGYTPQISTIVLETTTIYEQRVESLDLASVIRAVNGL